MSQLSISTRVLIAFIFWISVVSVALGSYFWQWLHTERVISSELREFVIEPGSNLYQVAARLKQQKLIAWPKIWIGYARLNKRTGVNAGEFRLAEKESPISLLRRFQSSEVISYSVTFIEGARAEDAFKALQGQAKLKHTLNPNKSIYAQQVDGIDKAYIEGWLFPDTYQYIAGDTDVDILQRAYAKTKEVLNDEWAKRVKGLPYKSPYEALIMASIVEKETGAPHERKQIAGVFVRRLKKGMRLQTDPTVIYGMGERYQGNITRKDLRDPTPYNTYTIPALPPSPIALAGRAAIHAALNPAPGRALYFVAKGDGTHYFSESLEEHNKAVVQYQHRRKESYRSQFKAD